MTSYKQQDLKDEILIYLFTYCAGSPDEGQLYPSDSCPGKGKNNHTHQPDYRPSSGLRADRWLEYRLCPPTSVSGYNIGKALCSLVFLHLWQTHSLTQLKLEVAPDWPNDTTGTKRCPQQAKSAAAQSR